MRLPTAEAAALYASLPVLAPKLGLILLRTAGLFTIFPLGMDVIPARVRGVLAVLVALVLLPVAPAPVPGHLALQLVAEGAVGLLAALLCRAPLAAVEAGMQISSVSAGLGIASLLDPATEEEVHALTELVTFAALVMFFRQGGHHQLLWALGQSLQRTPPGAAAVDGDSLRLVLHLGSELFIIAVQVAAPVLLLTLSLNVALALVSRAAPAVNIFSVSLVAILLCGLLAIWHSLPAVAEILRRGVDRAAEYFALGLWGPEIAR